MPILIVLKNKQEKLKRNVLFNLKLFMSVCDILTKVFHLDYRGLL